MEAQIHEQLAIDGFQYLFMSDTTIEKIGNC